jgi:hypothetical protein
MSNLAGVLSQTPVFPFDNVIDFCVQEELKRSYFICQTTRPIPAVTIGMATKVDIVYSKPFENGTLFVLRYLKSKKHSTIDNLIKSLDGTLRSMNSSAPFKSVSDVFSGKVKSFSGNDRLDDPLFREIFDISLEKRVEGELGLRENVKVWPDTGEEDEGEDGAQMAEDKPGEELCGTEDKACQVDNNNELKDQCDAKDKEISDLKTKLEATTKAHESDKVSAFFLSCTRLTPPPPSRV